MAESVVSNVVSQLTDLLIQEVLSLGGLRDPIEWVKTQLLRLQGFLKDADSRRKRGDARMESWISGIKRVAYEMEDVIDTINYMLERRHQRRGGIDSISRDICGIANLGESGVEKSSDWVDNLQILTQFSPYFYDDTGAYTDAIGFEHDKERLVKLLVDSENKKRSVISIVGMGGLGKTTLAKNVYNDPAVRKYFDAFAWVAVSINYRVIELLKDIVKKVMEIKEKKETTTGITLEELEQMGEEEVTEHLHNFLKDKRYLVVMDDVWSVDVWRQMHHIFPNGNNGSRILLTTRNVEVARRAEPWIPPHELHPLNDTQSLELFRRKAFPPKQDVPTELAALAKGLAKRCGGLPLALVVLGGFLSEKDHDTWSRVAKSWESSGDGQECLSILGSSYDNLPYPLKPCFLYIAAFPEDSTISASKLVRLWVAEGFVPQEQTRTMEETARDWLDNLVQRCMIQVVKRSVAYGRVKSISIHDMLRDFGLSEARKDGFLHVCSSDNMAISDGLSSRRAAFHHRINDEIANSSAHLRTLLGFKLVLNDTTAVGRFLNGLNLLRVLDLEDATDLRKLPRQIGNMIHLRYLGLRNTGLKRLPSSIGDLLNLQTLDVRETNIFWLPKSFWKIRMLRHLYINIDMFLSAKIPGDHKNLQTLQITGLGGFVNVYHFRRSFGKALGKMDSLVSLLLNVRLLPMDVLCAWAPNLHHLRSLNLYGQLLLEQQQLPDGCQFPPNLTKLILRESKLEHDPMPVLEKLPNLRLLALKLDVYLGKSMSCSAGGFPRLQHLILEGLHHLEEWRVGVGAMPCLTHLTIDGCWKLKMLPEGLECVTTLRELKLIEMPRAFNDRVRNEEEDGYKVRRIPSIIFEKECSRQLF
ncbi:putative disease resistance RPP13-like protein 3 isoform X2 [Elaeis guineensis]|uniref:Disease resistance RPP13-like protein 3 isoform X2 n=1 Tax=Elaeis guineensis var. tenera TaxID=51953 RepID=A0A6J0PE90_ELAGV|nr:putative disease resistance RPP13-like protein 3 isoform X2 [Elaeis guineensis]